MTVILVDSVTKPKGLLSFRPEVMRMSKSRIYKPGETAPVSGQYEIVDSTGTGTGVERTVVKGEPFPPTPNEGEGYVLVDKTKH